MPEFRTALVEVVPKIGAIYRHYKGAHYMVTGLARDSETKAIRVSYQKPGDDFPWSRLLTGTDPDGKPCGWCDIGHDFDGTVLWRFTLTPYTGFPDV